MDIMPTLFDLLGQNLGGSVDGQSFLPFVDGTYPEVLGREAIYLEFHGIRSLHTQRALITRDGLKCIFNPVDEDEMYDLNQDPGELHNLLTLARHRDQAQRLRRLMVQAAAESGDPVQNYMAKLFGEYGLLADQPDVSMAYGQKGQ
jgi:arylsulfatase A-like enzyme